MYQLEDNDEAFLDFTHYLYRLINRNNGKKNTMFIVGPPNSMKTTFIQALASFVLVKGQIQNFNRNNSFPLTDCVDKRILLWDEPNFDRNDLETIKLLFAGDPCVVSVKYSNNITITKTPVFCTANSHVFPSNDAFVSRMNTYFWSPPPFISDNYKMMNPLCFIDLFVKTGCSNKYEF